jgi:thiol-disulfide isomerase/thioredoxin
MTGTRSIRNQATFVMLWVLLAVPIGLGGSCANPSSTDAATPSADAAGAVAEAAVDLTLAPEFELANLAGTMVRLSDSAGQVRLIDFWATWCAPCREEIPMLNELHEGYRDQGLTILAISDEDAEIVAPFAEEYKVAYTNLVGGDEIFTEYGAPALPTAYLLDRDGRIVETFVGPKPKKVLEKKIRELLELPPRT